MTPSPVTVTYSLEEVLSRIEGKIDDLKKEVSEIRQKDLADLRVGQARLETELIGTKTELKTEIAGLKEDIKDIKGSQKAQIWTLIGVLSTAVVGTVIRFVITTLPSNP